MLGRKARPVIGNLMTGTSGSGFKPGVYDVIRSTKIPLDLIKIQSPRGLKNYGAAGVGLGIVAALEKTLESHATKALYNQSSVFKNRGHAEESEEDYTYVTSYGPNKRSHTRVYYDGCENSRKGSDRRSVKSHRVCVFDISPAITSSEVASSDFLSSCHMCQKKLHGEDIYMYRGEKAYCSTECRERQMVMDEKKENKFCSSRDVSTSPYTTNDYQMFTTGIFAI